MKWLLWRDFRSNGLILVAGASLLLLPYVFTLILTLWPRETRLNTEELAFSFSAAATFSYSISQLTVVLLGGNALAGERADRSAEFMAYLPVSRQRRLVSKLSLTAIVTVLIWLPNLLVLWSLLKITPLPEEFFNMHYTLMTCFVMFGVAWLISSFQSSPTFAICAGIVAPFFIGFGLLFTEWVLKLEEASHFFATGYTILTLVLGGVCFALGTCIFLNRIEP